jgi:hypothetical protein
VPGLPRGRGGRGPAWGLLSQPYVSTLCSTHVSQHRQDRRTCVGGQSGPSVPYHRMSDGRSTSELLQGQGTCRYGLAKRRSIFKGAHFSRCATTIDCCLADVWQRPGTTNGENRLVLVHLECCASGICICVECFCSQIYASRTPSISRTTQMPAPGLCSGCTKRRQRQPSGYAETDEHRQEMHVGSLVAVGVFV